jgi:hypothetical protein
MTATYRVSFSTSKLPYLKQVGIDFKIIKETEFLTEIDITVDEFTILDLFYAGEKKARDENKFCGVNK